MQIYSSIFFYQICKKRRIFFSLFCYTQIRLKSKKKEDKDSDNLIHQGIASRSVVRKFTLAEYIKVDSADFKDGILKINLIQEIPEEKKAKTIKIK